MIASLNIITSEPASKFPPPRTHLTATAAQSTPEPRHPTICLHLPLPIAKPFPARESTPKCVPATTAIAAKAKPAGPSAAPHLSAAAIHRSLHRSTLRPAPVPHHSFRWSLNSLVLQPSVGQPYSKLAILAGRQLPTPPESYVPLRPAHRDVRWIYRRHAKSAPLPALLPASRETLTVSSWANRE